LKELGRESPDFSFPLVRATSKVRSFAVYMTKFTTKVVVFAKGAVPKVTRLRTCNKVSVSARSEEELGIFRRRSCQMKRLIQVVVLLGILAVPALASGPGGTPGCDDKTCTGSAGQ
jgi:hypothetical protein